LLVPSAFKPSCFSCKAESRSTIIIVGQSLNHACATAQKLMVISDHSSYVIPNTSCYIK
jgi:ABC-type cobalamin/Fe3+-siderophores transport system ATPase subunit